MRLVVIGGGSAGSFYVRQLLRADAAGRLRVDRLEVLDRDPACAAAAFTTDARVALEVTDWSEWLEAHLGSLDPADHVVPYHWAPHLLFDWLAAELRRAGLAAERGPAPGLLGLPYEGPTRAGDRALSYATWLCPPTCIEPALCPHTRGEKAWSLAADLAGERPVGEASERVVFRSLHLAYGVATIPVAEILGARDRLVAAGRTGPQLALIATASHCHGLAATLRVAPQRC